MSVKLTYIITTLLYTTLCMFYGAYIHILSQSPLMVSKVSYKILVELESVRCN